MAKIATISLNANSVMPGITGFNINNTIDVTYKEPLVSPIDLFISNGIEINKLLTATPSTILGNLIILGYVSAIESYFRALIRKLIMIDTICGQTCEGKSVLYGAAISHKSDMLPEALFEEISFAGKSNIQQSFKNFLGFNFQDSSYPPDMQQTMDLFGEICHLRHCIVHRFGKFGVKNAITLGLEKHKNHIEKPIKLNFVILNQIITICHNTVRITNNFLFEKIMNRLVYANGAKVIDTPWRWDYSIDKGLFGQYFYLFYSKLNPPSPPHTPKKVYDKYHKHYLSL